MPFGFEKTELGTFLPSLHTHDDFSVKDGCSSTEQYAKNVVDLGGNSLAITNHGQAAGMARQYFACKAAKIKPIYGQEIYVNEKRLHLTRVQDALEVARKRVKAGIPGAKEKVAELTTFVREELRPGRHAILLARTRKGYQNLVRISSDAWLNGYYYAARTDTKFMAEHAEGLVYSTACIGGYIPVLARRDYAAGVAEARRLQGIFGPDNFYVELMATAYSKQRETNEVMLRLAHELGARTIVTTDVHYSRPEDQRAQSVLLLMRDDKTIKDAQAGEGAWQFDSKDLYWKSLEAVGATWAEHHKDYWPKEDFQKAIRNTYELAASTEQWDHDLSLKLPGIFPNPAAHLRDLVKKGLAERKARGHLPAAGKTLRDYAERLARELSVISGKNFDEYFLVLWDLVRHAREVGARMGPGRGSAGASLVAFVLGITEIDPLRFNLIFERFLDPSRKDAPDVDLDFSPEHREKIKQHLEKTYPAVATIGTFSTFKARSTILAVSKVYGLDRKEVQKITKPLGSVSAIDLDKMTFDEVCEMWPEVNELAKANPEAWEVIKTLDGLVSHRGQHASGVLVGPASALDELPMIRDPKTGTICTAFPDTAVQGGGTSYEGREISKLGWIKVDVLGQNTLNVAYGALELLQRDTGQTIDLRSIPLDDPVTLAVASTGVVPGVFQFDTPTSRPLLRHVGVDRFEDLAAITSLARPGPLKNRLHEKFAKLKKSDAWKLQVPECVHEPLAASRGLMIYQEDVMLTLVHVGGFSMEEANAVRKILAKKLDPELLVKWGKEFVVRGTARGHDPKGLVALYETLGAYCSYAFAKPHAMAYAREAYDQLYVLARHPLHYFASLLRTTERKKKGGRGEDVLVTNLRSAMEAGILVLPPDVRWSEVDFDVETGGLMGGDAIRYGLSKVKGVAGAAEAAVSVRAMIEEDGHLDSLTLETFVEHVDRKKCNAGAIGHLIHAGAFDGVAMRDSTGLEDLLEDVDESPITRRNALLVRHAFLTKKKKVFDRPAVFVPSVLMAMERDLLGILLSFWSSGEPATIRAAQGLLTIKEELARGAPRLHLLVEVSRLHVHPGRGGKMAFISFADETGTLDNVCLFPSQWAAAKDKLGLGKIAAVHLSRKESRDDRYGKWSYSLDDRSGAPSVSSLDGIRRKVASA